MTYSDDLRKVVAILERVMAAQMEGERLAIVETPSLKHIRVSKLMPSKEGIVRTVEVQLGNRKVSKKNPPVKNLVTAVQRLVLLVPADKLEQGPLES